MMQICSEGWSYNAVDCTVRVTGGGEISARVVSRSLWGGRPFRGISGRRGPR